ncbi:MAG: AmmeMemoRadiSam system radical SAM enzyme [Chloroflexi bacterium]|nr:AmmeMemoRadiSam system radical SAM enzyme [Chloroflexota bacterium]
MYPARLWHVEGEGLSAGQRVRCDLCAHRCLISEGKRGLCGVREVRGGELCTLVYGTLVAQDVDPIEKKPLFHFHPGSLALSIATEGCNLSCTFCQNADISQSVKDGRLRRGQYVEPEQVVAAAERTGSASIAYTYTEPTVFFEYSLDVCRLAHEHHLANIYVSNGYMTSEMLDLVTTSDGPPLVDAANIDLKAFTDAFYRKQCGARLQPVLDSLVRLKERRVWVEVTTLVIPGLNDSDGELRDIAMFIQMALGSDTPWHVSRFLPTYRLLDRPPTPVETLLRARDIGLEAGLHYVYTGNIPGQGGEDTLCPACGATIIARSGYALHFRSLRGGCCEVCGTAIAGIGM